MKINDSIKSLLADLKTETAKTEQTKGSTLKANSIMTGNKGGTASRRVTNANIENALNQSSGHKAVNSLLTNSPIGLTKLPAKEDIETMGYLDTGMRNWHKGAPIQYSSTDGGTITVYDGKGSANMGEDKRKIVYENGRYKQEMFYDEQGNLTEGKIVIRDETGNFTEQWYDFIVENNKIKYLIK